MKLFFRLLCAVLCICMVVPAIACANSNDENVTDVTTAADASDVTEDDTGLKPTVEKKDYKSEFTVMYTSDIYDPDNYFPAETDSAERVASAVFQRGMQIKDYLGVDIKNVDGGTYTAYYKVLQTSTKSGDDMFQMVMTHPYMNVASMISNGDVMSFSNLQSIQTDAQYWNGTLMEELSIDGEQYLGYNNFCLASCYVVVFNKQMYTDHTDFENPYELVDNYEWTLEKLITYSEEIAPDSNGDGSVTIEDKFGFSGFCWVPFVSFMTSSDILIVDKNEDGSMYVSVDKNYNEKMISLVSMMKDFYKSESTWMWDPFTVTESANFTGGGVLFSIPNNRDLPGYQAYDVKFGILPYPLFDSAQKSYKTLNWNGYLAIPSNVSNIDMVSDTVEMLAFYSDEVKTAYFEVLLGARIAEAPEDTRMLDIVWKGQISDLGLVFSDIGFDGLLYMLPNLAMGNKEYSSYFKQYSKQAEKSLSKFKIKSK